MICKPNFNITAEYTMACRGFILLALWIQGSFAGELRPYQNLKPGKLQNITVEYFSDAAKNPVQINFHLVRTGSEFVKGVDCWKLVYITGQTAPKTIARRLFVWIDKKQGWPRKISSIPSKNSFAIKKIGTASLVWPIPDGVPLDVIPNSNRETFAGNDAIVRLQSKRIGDMTLSELTYSAQGKEILKVRQRWTHGKGWWDYFERFEHGKLVLRAREAGMPPANDIFDKAEPVPKPKVVRSTLRNDKRLRAVVKLNTAKPTLAYMLEQIREATGLDIQTASQLYNHNPDLGSITPNAKGYLAWQLMEHIAKRQLQDGKWDKDGKGYRLTGVSTSQSSQVAGAKQDENPPFPVQWLIVSAVVLTVMASGLGLLLFFKRKKNTGD